MGMYLGCISGIYLDKLGVSKGYTFERPVEFFSNRVFKAFKGVKFFDRVFSNRHDFGYKKWRWGDSNLSRSDFMI